MIEAIQHTLPIIINDELGTAKMIKENGAGYVVHKINYSEIKEFLNKIDQNKYQDLQNNIKKAPAKVLVAKSREEVGRYLVLSYIFICLLYLLYLLQLD